MFRLIFPFVVPKNSFFSQRGKSYEQGFQLGQYKPGSVQPQKIAKGLKFRILEVEGLNHLCSENKVAEQLHSYHKVEPRYEKTALWGFRPGPTQTRLYNHTR